jgi:hypothetical protein
MNKIVKTLMLGASGVALAPGVMAHPGHEGFMSSSLHDFLHAMEASSLTVMGILVAAVIGYIVYRSNSG